MTEEKSVNNQIPEVRVLQDGPIMIKGFISLKDSSGKITVGEQEIYLCRCGGSKNKPWCDETHKKIGVPN
jgi:CDGSH-type Zn-finger protein